MWLEVLAADRCSDVVQGTQVGAHDAFTRVDQGQVEVETDDQGGAGMPPLCRGVIRSAHPAVGHGAGPQGGELHVVAGLGCVPDAAGAGVDAHVVDVATAA